MVRRLSNDSKQQQLLPKRLSFVSSESATLYPAEATLVEARSQSTTQRGSSASITPNRRCGRESDAAEAVPDRCDVFWCLAASGAEGE